MNEINITDSNLERAKLLTTKFASVLFYQITPITFALVDRSNRYAIFAFASSALSSYFQENEGVHIHDVSFVRHELLAGSHPWAEKSIHLQLKNKTTVVLDSNDRVYLYSRFHASNALTGRLISPHKMWGASPLGHFGMMLLTERLVGLIEGLCSEGQQLQMVHVFWKEYEIARHKDAENDQIYITGEIMEFSARRFTRGGLVIFDIITSRS